MHSFLSAKLNIICHVNHAFTASYPPSGLLNMYHVNITQSIRHVHHFEYLLTCNMNAQLLFATLTIIYVSTLTSYPPSLLLYFMLPCMQAFCPPILKVKYHVNIRHLDYTRWGDQSWTKMFFFFSICRHSCLIEAYVRPENVWLVCAGLLANHLFNINLIFLSNGGPAAVECAAGPADEFCC
jgi:hypothetical protein